MDERLLYPLVMMLWGICVAGIVWYLGKTTLQVTSVTLADGRRREKKLPFLFRALLPFAPVFIPTFRKPAFKRARHMCAEKLSAAGYEDVLKSEEFLGLRALVPLVAGPALIILTAVFISLGHGSVSPVRQLSLYSALFFWALFYPGFWLNRAVAVRHRSIIRALPFVMDLLTLSVESGLDFMAAIRNILDRRPMDPLGEELSRMLFEIQLGKTRREALRTMAARINHVDIRSLVAALVQADELGVSIGAILRIQSDQIRARRFMRAEKLANEAPVKLLFPLLACIFPAVMLILLGPVFLQIIQYGF